MGANRSIKAEVDQVVTADLDVIEAKCGREYTDQVRLWFYDMVAAGVSVNKCSDLLQNILAGVGKQLSTVPSASWAKQTVAGEMHQLAQG